MVGKHPVGLAALLSKLVAVLLSKSVGRPVPLIWIIVRPGPTVLAVGAGGDCLDIFLSFSLGDGSI